MQEEVEVSDEEQKLIESEIQNDLSEEEEEEEDFEESIQKEARIKINLEKKKEKKKHFGSFNTMGLSENTFKGIARKGYNIPTPIQRKAIPIILQGRDVVAMARTGSGKTAAFLIPLFEKLKTHSDIVGARALIISPTRELSQQTIKFVYQLGKFTGLRSCLLVGGDSMEEQFADLATNPDILVGTPGRILHHVHEVGLSLKTVEYVVFDEADRLFEMGLQEQVQEICSCLSENRQTLLFSATLPQTLVDFARAGLTNPEVIRLDTETKISENLKMHFFSSRPEEKLAILLYLLQYLIDSNQQTVIFVATRHHVEFLHELLGYFNFNTTVIYGSMDQTARKINIAKFRNGKSKILIVTDVAARGIDVPLLDNVINYDFSPKPKLFVHRVGRVARMGRSGTAYSLVAPDELPYMLDLFLFLGEPFPKNVSSENFTFGKLPQDLIDSSDELIKAQLNLHMSLRSMLQVIQNAYKLYYKTRSNPSGESIHRMKEEAESFIPPIHPLIEKMLGTNESERDGILQKIKNFRPPQTIFEIDVTKKLTTGNIMEWKRKEHENLIEQKKEKVKKKKKGKEKKDEIEKEEIDELDKLQSLKRKMNEEIHVEAPSKKKRKTSFRDEQYFLPNLPSNYQTEKGLSVRDDINSNDLALDISADDPDEIKKQRIIKKWDRKKKKFIYVNNGEEKKNKKIRNEAGQLVTPKERGKIYEEWKYKTKFAIPTVGQKEDINQTNLLKRDPTQKKFRHKASHAKKEELNAEIEKKSRWNSKVKSELKSKDQIAKNRRIEKKKKERFQQKKSGKKRNSKGKKKY